MSTHHDALFSILLTQPPGTYALSRYGQTHAVVLTGCPTFHSRGYNLFLNGGGESKRDARAETPLPPLRLTDDPRVVWFCLPEARVQLALRLWCYGQLYRLNARDVIDAEGDFVETVVDDETALMAEAEQLALDFVAWHMRPDYSALPSYEFDPIWVEHRLGVIDRGGEDA